MNRIVILNTPEVPVFGTHLFHAKKLCEGFRWNGLDVVEVNALDELNQIGLCEKDFIYISNHIINGTDDPMFCRPSVLVERLFEFIAYKKCIPILWFWHSLVDNPLMGILRDRYILTGEHFRQRPKMSSHALCWDIQQTIKNYVPSTFATAIHPDQIGKMKRNETKKASFVGFYYEPMWLDRMKQEFPNDVMITGTPPFISNEDRLKHFSDSVTCLGFTSPEFIHNYVVNERVFEGLSMGNVVISNNPCSSEITDGIVDFVDSYDRMIELVDKAWKDKKYRVDKQKRGIEWCRNHGTYYSVAKPFLEKAGEING